MRELAAQEKVDDIPQEEMDHVQIQSHTCAVAGKASAASLVRLTMRKSKYVSMFRLRLQELRNRSMEGCREQRTLLAGVSVPSTSKRQIVSFIGRSCSEGYTLAAPVAIVACFVGLSSALV